MNLEKTFETLLARRRDAGRLRQLNVNPPGLVDFSSNDYLSFAENAEIQRNVLTRFEHRVAAATREKAAIPSQDQRRILGSGGSRLLDGNSTSAENLEKKVASFHGAAAAILFNSAYDANVGLLSCAPQIGDLILFDEAIHASIHDGMRLSRATECLPFSHASVTGATESSTAPESTVPGVDTILKQITEAGYPNAGVRDGTSNVFICVEGVYSMDGSVLRASELVKTVKKYLPRGNGHIIVDEAHSTGVLGTRGRGLVCESGLEKEIWARVHGFGKAMGCAGGKNCDPKSKTDETQLANTELGVVLCSPMTRAYLINYARTLIYTTSMTFTSLVCIDTAYDYLVSGHAEPARQHLLKLVGFTYQLIRDICHDHAPLPKLLRVGKKPPGSPILPIFTANPRSLASFCQLKGFMVRPIVAPTVPVGTERVRLCLHAQNTFEQVEGLGEVIKQWIREQTVTEDVGELDTDTARVGRPRL